VEWDLWGAIKALYSGLYPYIRRLTEDNQKMRKIISTKELTEEESYNFKEICKVPGDYQESSRILLEACNRAAANRSKDTNLYINGRKGWKK
jgi:hypothetical protein